MTATLTKLECDRLHWNVDVEVKKWHDEEKLAALGLAYASGEEIERFLGEPDDIVEVQHNLLLNAGITRLLSLLVGAGGTAFNNANSRIGVGDSSTAESAAHTDLIAATNKYYKVMDATFPSVASQTATWRSTFATGEANFAWNEWGIDNGAASNSTPVPPMLNRRVVTLGTKASGSWQLTTSITIA